LTAVLQALVVEDDKNALGALAELVADEGFAVEKATSVRTARARLVTRTPDVVLLDLILPDGTGFDLIRDLRKHTERVEIVVITGHASVSTAVEALRHGASDYLTKPVDAARLKLMLANLRRSRELRPRLSELRRQVRQLGRFGMLVGAAPAMERVYEMVSRVAPSSASVLVTGESGTGKELVAETLHQLSRRAANPYLVLNCGALSPTLIESELFGHERGSFTGADRVHRGFFERADGGTLFLDEVSEIPVDLQAKLLRVLETGALTRVGGEKTVRVDVRIIAATNRDLDARVAEGKFRGDLLYRLKVFPIDLPPLRERVEDIAGLAHHFLGELNRQDGTEKGFTPAALAILQRCAWPGNVRELKNVIHRAFILAEKEIGPSHLAPELSGPTTADGLPGALTTLAEAQRRLILATLEHFDGDKRKAAEALGVSLRTMYNRLREYGPE
jgi:two-component system, NtrC family, response regulator HydG